MKKELLFVLGFAFLGLFTSCKEQAAETTEETMEAPAEEAAPVEEVAPATETVDTTAQATEGAAQ